MAKWLGGQPEPFLYNPIQMQFLAERRLRWCYACKKTYNCPPDIVCPTCSVKGSRFYDRLLIRAGRRFGKTLIGAISGAEEATIPNTLGWACAPTNDKLHRYVIPAMQRIIPEDAVVPNGWSIEYQDLRLKNGSIIHFQTLEDPDQGRGQGLDWLWIDEVCELTKAHWDVIRPSLAGDTAAFFTTSPRGYDWVNDELAMPAERGDPGYRLYVAKTSESSNPRISQEFLARERAQMSDEMYRQEYEADLVSFTGAVYGSAIDAQILPNDQAVQSLIPEWPSIAPWRQILVGLDTGADHPFGAVKIAVIEQGLVVIDEYLERNKPFIEHKFHLWGMANNAATRWAINKNDKQGMIELAQPPHAISNLHPAENELISGTERVKSWLTAKQLFFAAPKCPRTIKQMKSYRWAENYNPKDESKRNREKVYKKNDELPDALRYALMTWPRLPVVDPVVDLRRDLSGLPKEMRMTIERERKAEDTYRNSEVGSPTIAEDFWG